MKKIVALVITLFSAWLMVGCRTGSSMFSHIASKAETLQDATTAQAVTTLRGEILSIRSDRTLVISLGESDGLNKGDTVNVYELRSLRDAQGQERMVQETFVGELLITAANQKTSFAKKAGSFPAELGWTVRPKATPPR